MEEGIYPRGGYLYERQHSVVPRNRWGIDTIKGTRLAIISTKYRYRIQAVIDKYFPKDFIDVIIGGEDVKHAKPHPQGVRTALRRLKAKKELTLYVGDSTVDAETAQNAKIDFCGVLNGLTTREELTCYPHRQILDNLTLLPLLQKDYLLTQGLGSARHHAAIIHQIRGNQNVPLKKLEQHVCQNCGDTFEGDFCRSCGQPAKTKRITLKYFFRNLLSSFTDIEHGFLRTCYELWWRPGYMVKDYVKGKRIGYYKPFSLLIVMAAIYLVAGQLLDPKVPDQSDTDEKRVETKIDSLASQIVPLSKDTIALTSDNTLLEDEEDEQENETDTTKADIEIKLKEWINKYAGPGTFVHSLADLLAGWFADNQAFLFIVNIPFYLFGVRRSFRHTRVNHQLNLGENVFIFGYFGSQIIMKDTLLIPLIGAGTSTEVSASIPFFSSLTIEILLMVRNFKQLFCLSWKEAIKGTIKSYIYMYAGAFLFIAAIIALIALIAGTIIALIS